MKKKILVTGASGLLGCAALQEFAPHFETTGIYNQHPIEYPGTRCLQLDLSNLNHAKALFDELKPDYVFHTAAAVNIDQCEKDRAWAHKINTQLPSFLSELSNKAGATFVQISTDAFFGNNEPPSSRKLHTETDKPVPTNYYAETKLLAEQAVAQNAPNHLILRTNIYGWNHQKKQSLAEWIYFSLKDGKTIPSVNDVFYTPILTNTLCRTTRLMLEKGLTGLFHVSSSESISKYEFAKKLCSVFGLNQNQLAPASVDSLKLTAARSKNMALSNEKLRKALAGWDCTVLSDLAEFKRLGK